MVYKPSRDLGLRFGIVNSLKRLFLVLVVVITGVADGHLKCGGRGSALPPHFCCHTAAPVAVFDPPCYPCCCTALMYRPAASGLAAGGGGSGHI